MRFSFHIFGVFSVIFAISAHATTLTLDQAQSQVTLSGTVAGSTLREQGPNSLSTTVGGSMDVSLADGQIQITGANLDPNVNGNWAPGRNGESASPADLAGQATAFGLPVTGALRDLVVTASSGPKPLQPGGQFDASSIVFYFPTNSSSVLDYDSFVTGKGSKPLAGAGTNQTATVGTFVDNNGVQTLTIALNATFYFALVTPNDTALTLKGQIVATSGSALGPTITSANVVNGEFQFTATNTSANTVVESSTTLNSWGPQEAVIAASDPTTRNFTILANDKFRFFRLKQ